MKGSFFCKSFSIILLFCAQIPDIQAQKPYYFTADSLFKQQQWQASLSEYQQQLRLHPESHPWVHVKMAFAAEKLNLWAEALFHLEQYYAFQPTDGVYDKLLILAETHQLEGYDLDDVNFLYTLYLEYYPYVMGVLLLFAMYLLWVFWQKRTQAQPISIRYQTLFYGYILLLVALTNTFSWLQFGIIRSEEALVREKPSAGAETIGRIKQGHKINIVGSHDIWYHVYAHSQLGYIKKSDLWLIK